jgi:hypothetical protein
VLFGRPGARALLPRERVAVYAPLVAQRFYGGKKWSLKVRLKNRGALAPQTPELQYNSRGLKMSSLWAWLGAEAKYDLYYLSHSRPIVN